MSRGYKIKNYKSIKKSLKASIIHIEKKSKCAFSFNSQWKNKIVSNVEQRITNFEMSQTNIEKRRSK
jgi:hypothetical protein